MKYKYYIAHIKPGALFYDKLKKHDPIIYRYKGSGLNTQRYNRIRCEWINSDNINFINRALSGKSSQYAFNELSYEDLVLEML